MKFEPKSREEFNNERLIPAKTICEGVVERAEEKTSSKGNPMIAISLKVYHGAQGIFVNDWLVAGSQKLLNFCDVAGLSDAYLKGEVTAELVQGRNVTVKVGIDEAKDGFQARNKIVDYVLPKKAKADATATNGEKPSAKGLGVPESQRRAAVAAAPKDEDIPF